MRATTIRPKLVRTNLERIRRKRGWSQYKMGLVTDIPQCWISYFEIGRGIPDAAQLQRLAAALDIAPDEVLKPPPVDQPMDETTEAVRRVANVEAGR